jgi:hypothetical protein
MSNKQYGEKVINAAGDILFSKFGLEVGKDKFSVGINAMLPQPNLSRNIEANYEWSVNLNYTL